MQVMGLAPEVGSATPLHVPRSGTTLHPATAYGAAEVGVGV